jgi:hypothetical protein
LCFEVGFIFVASEQIFWVIKNEFNLFVLKLNLIFEHYIFVFCMGNYFWVLGSFAWTLVARCGLFHFAYVLYHSLDIWTLVGLEDIEHGNLMNWNKCEKNHIVRRGSLFICHKRFTLFPIFPIFSFFFPFLPFFLSIYLASTRMCLATLTTMRW